ncbi:MAG: UvrD-helicase domain-containing protein [Planctomycetes bacterium]|nr:UvrD-helicase domain-containing protein [Planctomycetota bacterium]
MQRRHVSAHRFSLDGLNPEQRAAVQRTEGPVLVLAGAGTGKTRVITHRIVHLLQKGVSDASILAVTFTNKAAREMKQRVLALLRKGDGRNLWIGTFHSFCARVLREEIHALGYRPGFSIYDVGDQLGVVRRALRAVKVAGTEADPFVVLQAISRAKNQSKTPAQFARTASGPLHDIAALAYPRYQKELKGCNAVDFDDLLLLTLQLFKKRPEVLQRYRQRFRYVLIDEFQDTNETQYQLVRQLCREHKNLCAVGDDDQSIYGWRGAQVGNIARFEKDFPGTFAVKLEENYRSTASILAVANAVIRSNLGRRDKVLRTSQGAGLPVELWTAPDSRAEAEGIAARILAHRQVSGRRFSDFAVLFRTHTQSRPIEECLRAARIPYHLLGGPSFFERKEVRDLAAYLAALQNPDDEAALFRIINCPPRGIGETTLEKVNRFSLDRGIRFHDALGRTPEISGLSASAAKHVVAFFDLLQRYRARVQSGRLAETLRALLEEIDYSAELEQNYKDPLEVKARLAVVEEMVQAAADYERRAASPSLSGLLEELALDESPDRDQEDQADVVRLITLHSAKGLEFPAVFLLGIEDGMLPHQKSISDEREELIEEERRLFYVGITRARQELVLTMATTRTQFGKPVPTLPSRFLGEIPDQLLRKVSESSGDGADASAREQFYLDAIRKRLKGS